MSLDAAADRAFRQYVFAEIPVFRSAGRYYEKRGFVKKEDRFRYAVDRCAVAVRAWYVRVYQAGYEGRQ